MSCVWIKVEVCERQEKMPLSYKASKRLRPERVCVFMCVREREVEKEKRTEVG